MSTVAPPTTPPKTAAVATIKEDDWKKPQPVSVLEKSFLPLMAGQLAKGLPQTIAGNADRFLRCMMTACRVNPALLSCSPLSLFAATIQAAQLGLEIGGPTGFAYLIPYSGEATLQIGYKGFLQLGYRSNAIRRVTPVEVRQGDLYIVVRGMEQKLIHEPVRNNKGIVTDYYVVVELVNGGKDFEEMTVDDAIAWRDKYASTRKYKSGPWYAPPAPNGDPSNEFNQMAMKTLIRKLFKRLPVSAESLLAAGLDEQGEMGIPQNLPQMMLPEFADETAVDRLEQRLEDRKKPKREEGESDASSPPPSPPAAPPPSPPTTPGKKSELATLLDRLDAESGDADAVMGWIKAEGYESLQDMEQLRPEKQQKLCKKLEAKIAELTGA